MSLRYPLFHRTILALLLNSLEAVYEHPTLENLAVFKEKLIQELEEGIWPIIEKRCYRNPSVTRNDEILRSLSVKKYLQKKLGKIQFHPYSMIKALEMTNKITNNLSLGIKD